MSASGDISSGGARRSGGAPVQRLQHSLCAFWLGEQCYGLETTMVGEVMTVDAVAPVPLAPAPVRGLFNLRGTPVALVDLSRVLELPDLMPVEEPRPGRPLVALVLRTETMLVGLLIRRMEMVITRGRGTFSPPEATGAEHPVVAGFLELTDRGGLTVTVLDPDALLSRLDRLKYLDPSNG
jgi:purine-binding chemotaxis protein CheW